MTIGQKNRAGFTLIEIMVVILIIGILSAGLGAGIFGYLRKAKVRTTDQVLKRAKLEIETYRQDVGELPNSLNDLVRRPSAPELASKWRGPYADDGIPKDGWGNELMYKRSPKGTRPPFKLYSWGTGGEGSPDDEHISI